MQASCARQAYIASVTFCLLVFYVQSEELAHGKDSQFCPVVESLRFVGNEKRLFIIRYLMDGPLRYNELLKFGIDSKTLSRALKNLEHNGIVRREILSTQPFSVRYSLTEKGRALKSVIDSLRTWAETWVVKPMETQDALYA